MKLRSITIMLVFSPSMLLADECKDVLTTKAFNTTDYQTSAKLLLNKRSEACSKIYDSKGEANSSGRSIGADIGFKGFSFGGNYAKQTANNKWSISDSDVCNKLAEAIDSAESTNLKTQVTDLALKSWSSCISESKRDALYLEYSINPDGTGFSGTINRSVGNGAFGAITGIQESTKGVLESCTIGNYAFEPTKEFTTQRINKARINISCTKNKNKSFKISILTDQGDLPWVWLPTEVEKEATDLENLKLSLNSLKSDFSELAQNQTSQAESFNTNLNSINSTLSDKADGINAELGRVKSTLNLIKNRRWHNVTASRRVGVNIRNTRDYPIAVSIIADAHKALNGGGNRNRCMAKIMISNNTIASHKNNNDKSNKVCTVFAIVPPNAVYKVQTGAFGIPANRSVTSWDELY